MAKLHKVKSIVRSGIPSFREMQLVFKVLILGLIVASFWYLVLYSSTSASANSAQQGAIDNSSAGRGLITMLTTAAMDEAYFAQKPAGQDCLSNLEDSAGGFQTYKDSPYYCKGQRLDTTDAGASAPGVYNLANYGPTGRMINGTTALVDQDIAHPLESVNYYANRIQGKTHAAGPTTGREVLTPIFFLSQTMRNLAYGIVIIVLVLSSISLLLGSLGGGDQKFTLVQLLMNTGVTIFLITFFYEISAIIYDLTVNYGNALVVSVMEPFINARAIYERLQPGGDLNITALVNTFQFIGVSEGLRTVVSNVTTGLYPTITQTFSAAPGAIPGAGPFLSFIGGGLSLGINYVLSNFLNSQEIFDAIIAWTIFLINVKIFFNLIMAFVTFNLYVAFGPLLMLRGIYQGYAQIGNTFKLLFAYAMVFPFTFLCILLGAAAMNIFIRGGGNPDTVAPIPLCAYAPGDPANLEQEGWLGDGTSIEERGDLGMWLGGAYNYDDPGSFRNRNLINQDIFDVAPDGFITVDGQVYRDCRSKLFPEPWTFVPAPFGNVGNSLVQVQTTDALVRTFLGIGFIILAGRAPNVLKELLEVKELQSLQGLGKSFVTGLKPFLGLGAVALGTTSGAALGLGKIAGNAQIGGLKKFEGAFSRFGGRFQLKDSQSIAGLVGKFKQSSNPNATLAEGYGKMRDDFTSLKDSSGSPIMSPQEAQLIAGSRVAQQFEQLTSHVSTIGNAFDSAAGSLKLFDNMIQTASRQLGTLINLSYIDEL
ncbi:MAG: hypothetical protein ACOCXT_03375 [Candidatus Dojkabacteria bacterium]